MVQDESREDEPLSQAEDSAWAEYFRFARLPRKRPRGCAAILWVCNLDVTPGAFPCIRLTAR